MPIRCREDGDVVGTSSRSLRPYRQRQNERENKSERIHFKQGTSANKEGDEESEKRENAGEDGRSYSEQKVSG